MLKWFELGITTEVMKEQVASSGGLTKRWSMNMEIKIMVIKHLVIDKE